MFQYIYTVFNKLHYTNIQYCNIYLIKIEILFDRNSHVSTIKPQLPEERDVALW